MTNERVWGVIGKIATVVTAVGGLVAIYFVVFPSGPLLQAQAEYQDFVLAPDLTQSLSSLQRQLEPGAIAATVDAVVRRDKSGVTPEPIAAAVGDVFEKAWSEVTRRRLEAYRSYWTVAIQNTGDRPAADVILAVPFDGLATIDGDGRTIETVNVSRRISLGELRAGNSVTIAVWSESPVPFPSLLEEEVKLTHSAGTGTVSYPVKSWGVTAWLVENVGIMVALVVGGLLGTSGAWLPLLLSKRRASRQAQETKAV
jgi:hypothetical protein